MVGRFAGRTRRKSGPNLIKQGLSLSLFLSRAGMFPSRRPRHVAAHERQLEPAAKVPPKKLSKRKGGLPKRESEDSLSDPARDAGSRCRVCLAARDCLWPPVGHF